MSNHAENMSFLTGANADYIAYLFGAYLKNPASVDTSWKAFFDGLGDHEIAVLRDLDGASWTPEENKKISKTREVVDASTLEVEGKAANDKGKGKKSAASGADVQQAATDSIRALQLIRAYRARGHMHSKLDPLGLKEREPQPVLDPAHYGFTDADMDREIYLGGSLGIESASLRDIVAALTETYCGTIGAEFTHLADPEEKQWIQHRMEAGHNHTDFTPEGKRAILQRLIESETFEAFLHKKYPGTKRFGVDGGEILIPAIEQIMKRGGQLGLEDIVLGMAHRGRLNVLGNVMGKPFTAIFAEFAGQSSVPEEFLGSGDVKYHMGTSSDRDFDGNNIHLSLTANPSHLEFVNPVVTGKVRAKQMQRGDVQSTAVLPLLLHGDAAFAGQGVTAETLMIAELPGYRVGGTIHIVINNQIGFTTMPKYGRSGPYSTDVAKMLSAPILHVNGDDAEAVIHAARIAIEFRQQFKKDVVLDIYCYRRFGHNEGDEPMFTQPVMYKEIKQHPNASVIYTQKLIAEGVATQEDADGYAQAFTEQLEADFQAASSYKPNDADFLGGAWEGLEVASGEDRRGKTGVPKKKLQALAETLTTAPDGFEINKKLQRVLEARREAITSGKGLDWGTAESLAFATLLDEDYAVRLSGQDVGRGTFSHRHAIWYDQNTNEQYYPHKNIKPDQPVLEVHDSPLSEMAVLGFEYGYSLADPNTLTMWEAQFGDFVNGAQVMIDQFISSGEIKWLRMSGLVMLLPHGYEGQGPEHSSARPERFLQLCAEDNMQVANCTTPANYFHILRRQMKREFRKPLVIMTPKSLLRHKLAVSDLDMLSGDSTFHRVLWDDDQDKLAKPDKIKRVVLCTGKVYYDLLQERRERGIKDVLILRVEQLYPFPHAALIKELEAFKNADIVWCQEEPKNQGYWFFVEPLIEDVLADMKHKAGRASYAGRPAAAAPATGLARRHAEQQASLIDDALSVGKAGKKAKKK